MASYPVSCRRAVMRSVASGVVPTGISSWAVTSFPCTLGKKENPMYPLLAKLKEMNSSDTPATRVTP
jgi:hypothetical protein